MAMKTRKKRKKLAMMKRKKLPMKRLMNIDSHFK